MDSTYKGHEISCTAVLTRTKGGGFAAHYVVKVMAAGKERTYPGALATPFNTRQDALAAAMTAAKRFIDER